MYYLFGFTSHSMVKRYGMLIHFAGLYKYLFHAYITAMCINGNDQFAAYAPPLQAGSNSKIVNRTAILVCCKMQTFPGTKPADVKVSLHEEDMASFSTFGY